MLPHFPLQILQPVTNATLSLIGCTCSLFIHEIILALIWTDNPHLTVKSNCIIKQLHFINKYQQGIASVTVHNFVTGKADNNLSQPGPQKTQSEKYTLTNSLNNIEPLFPIQQLCIDIRDAFPPANGVATHHDVLVTRWVPWHSDGVCHWPSCNKNVRQDSLTPYSSHSWEYDCSAAQTISQLLLNPIFTIMFALNCHWNLHWISPPKPTFTESSNTDFIADKSGISGHFCFCSNK